MKNRLTLLLCCSAIIVAYVQFYAVASLSTVLMTELDLTHMGVGSLMSVTLVAYALFNLVGGLLTDKLGTKKMMIGGTALVSSAGFLFGLTANCMQALLCRLFLGIGMALVWTSGVKHLSFFFSFKQRMTAIGIFIASIGLADIIAKVAPPFLFSSQGWRFTFSSIAIPGFLLALVELFYIREGSLTKENPSETKNLERWLPWKDNLVLVMSVLYFSVLFQIYATSSWIPSYLVENWGLELTIAGLVSAIMATSSVLSPIIGSIVANRIGKLPVVLIGFLIMMLTVILEAPIRQMYLLVPLLLILAFSGSFITSSALAFLVENVPSEASGMSVGFVSTIGYLGGVISTLLGGYSIDLTGSYIILYGACSFLAVISSVITFAILRRRTG